MAAPKGNKFWQQRTKIGRDKIFESPENLQEACIEYFEWVEANPLREAIIHNGKVSRSSKRLMRPMSIGGLCTFLGIGETTWYRYKKEQDYKDFWDTVEYVEQVMKTQKFEGAAVGFFKENIVARDLGLKDQSKSEIDTTVKHTHTVRFIGVPKDA